MHLLERIETVKQTRVNGLAWIEVLFVVFVLAGFFVVVLLPSISRERMLNNRMACGDNLRAIGEAMSTYASDYEGMLPVAGGQGAQWVASLPSWAAASRQEAFGLEPDGSGGQATISSSLYLLVRHMELAPKTFVCRVDRGTRAFRPNSYGQAPNGSANIWDFGPNPGKHCSYAYEMVYSPYAPNGVQSAPGFAIAADRNPWIDPPHGKAGEFSKYRPDLRPDGGTAEQGRFGNATAHERVGQNVMFLDTHVEFEQRPFCGLEDDNIYTVSGNATGADPLGVPPKLGSAPTNAKDSLLVNDPVNPSE